MLRIGIVKEDEPPLTLLECFKRENSVLLLSERCSKPPGYAVEIVQLILFYLNHGLDQTRFIPATGWSFTPNGTGLVNYALTKHVDFTVGQLGFTYARSLDITYSTPTIFQSGPCFLLCGQEHFLRIQSFAIVNRFFGNKLLLLLITISFLLLFLARAVERKGKLVASLLDTVLNRPKEGSLIGRLHSRLFTTLILFVVLRGVCKAGLIKVFSPKRAFPLETVKQLGYGIEKGDYQLAFISDTASSYQLLLQVAVYADVAKALKVRKAEFIGNDRNNIEKCFLERPNLVYMAVPFNIGNFLKVKRDLNCICHPLNAPSFSMHGGLAFNRKNKPMSEKIERIVLLLREFGFTQHLEQKYRLISEKVIDSEKMKDEGLKPLSTVRSLPFQIIVGIFSVYFATLLIACVILLLERLYIRNY